MDQVQPAIKTSIIIADRTHLKERVIVVYEEIQKKVLANLKIIKLIRILLWMMDKKVFHNKITRLQKSRSPKLITVSKMSLPWRILSWSKVLVQM